MKIKKPNAVQASLIYPAVATFLLSGIGTAGLGIGFLGSLVATPIMFWKFSRADRSKWKKVSYLVLLTGTTLFISAVSGTAGIEIIFKNLNRSGYDKWKIEQTGIDAEESKDSSVKPTDAKENVDESSGKEVEKTIKPMPAFKFSATAYTVDSAPETTVGNAILNTKEGYAQWYTEIKSGGYANYRYSHRCYKNGSVGEMDLHGTDNQWKADTNSKCKINGSSNGAPSTFSLVLSDGFVYQKVRVTTANQISTAPRATPVQKLPDRTAVIVECKKYAVNRSATGKVDWNAFGTGDPRWIGNIATVFLSGKTKNEYGTKIPFTIECRGNQDGSIKLVKIVRQ